MHHPQQYRHEEVVVLGLARSGQAVAKLFAAAGARVTVNDVKPRSECPEADELERLGIRVICGEHPPDLIHEGVKLVVKNPGIPYRIAPLVKAARLDIEVVTEVEVAWHLAAGPLIGITGSNGKTTTTTWIGHMLEASGQRPVIAGNIGRPLCEAVAEAKTDDWIVAELSSFQLKGTTAFRPRVACLLNFRETHLDYHGSLEDYWASKLKLFANQTEEDRAILNWDDPACRELAGSLKGQVIPFSTEELDGPGVCVADGRIVVRERTGHEVVLADVTEIGLAGRHNLENALAAVAVAWCAGAAPDAITAQLRSFRGVAHRQEFVGEVRGVHYYNDSKATNPTAALTALSAFTAPIVWIGGGLDRGTGFSELAAVMADRVKAVVVLGETRHQLATLAREAGVKTVIVVEPDTAERAEEAVEEAVRAASRAAERGDVVLFSPACASWDMFPSYEERGRMFQASVHRL